MKTLCMEFEITNEQSETLYLLQENGEIEFGEWHDALAQVVRDWLDAKREDILSEK